MVVKLEVRGGIDVQRFQPGINLKKFLLAARPEAVPVLNPGTQRTAEFHSPFSDFLLVSDYVESAVDGSVMKTQVPAFTGGNAQLIEGVLHSVAAEFHPLVPTHSCHRRYAVRAVYEQGWYLSKVYFLD